MGRSSSLKCYVVYHLHHRVTRKVYIGKTGGRGSPIYVARRRLAEHIRAAAGDSALAVHRALRKYGHETFVLTLIGVYETETEALAAEIAAIAKFKTFINDPDCRGYNMTRGGEGISGAKFSAEARAKISAKMRGKKLSPEQRAKMDAGRVGIPLSAERRAKIGAANRGRVPTPEARAKLSAAGRGRKMADRTKALLRTANIGRKHTDETKLKMRGKRPALSAEHRAKMSAAHKGRKQRPEWVAKRIAASVAAKAARRAVRSALKKQ